MRISDWSSDVCSSDLFLKFCGLDLATRQSGLFRGRTKLSKYGSARLRRTFWMATQVAIRQPNNSFRDKLGRYVAGHARSEEHTSELQSLMRTSYAVFWLKKNIIQYKAYKVRVKSK